MELAEYIRLPTARSGATEAMSPPANVTASGPACGPIVALGTVPEP